MKQDGALSAPPSRGPWHLPLSFFFAIFLVSSVFAEEPAVRVAIVQETPSVKVTVLSPCRLIDLKSGTLLKELPSLLWQEAKVSDPGIVVGQDRFDAQGILIEPKQEAIVRVNARPYRGSIILLRTDKGRITVVNRLGLEEYLISALASEANPNWPLEALKAHAVVSRTMIAHRIWIAKGRPFDVTADTATHLYYGVAAERQGTRAAVEATRGQVLSHAGELLSVTFHANCGGHTEDAAELWEGKGDLAPLEGRPDPYCKDLRHYRWSAKLSERDFMERLADAGKEIGKLASMEVIERNRSGRVRQVRLAGDGATATLSGRRLRELLGPNHLRSLNFTVKVRDHRIFFDGYGWGHGVGLCQWGAYGQASRGRSAEEILNFYFPIAKRRALKGLPGFTS